MKSYRLLERNGNLIVGFIVDRILCSSRRRENKFGLTSFGPIGNTPLTALSLNTVPVEAVSVPPESWPVNAPTSPAATVPAPPPAATSNFPARADRERSQWMLRFHPISNPKSNVRFGIVLGCGRSRVSRNLNNRLVTFQTSSGASVVSGDIQLDTASKRKVDNFSATFGV